MGSFSNRNKGSLAERLAALREKVAADKLSKAELEERLTPTINLILQELQGLSIVQINQCAGLGVSIIGKPEDEASGWLLHFPDSDPKKSGAYVPLHLVGEGRYGNVVSQATVDRVAFETMPIESIQAVEKALSQLDGWTDT